MGEIVIPVDDEFESKFKKLSDSEKRKYGLMLKIHMNSDQDPNEELKYLMKEMSSEAKRNGLTPEILESILADA